VHVVHRGEKFDARPRLVGRIGAQSNITVHWRTRVEAVFGDKTLHGVRVSSEGENAATSEIACSGLFPYIGLEPVCDFAPPQVLRDAAGFLLTDARLQTAMPGVYAAGAVRSGYGGLLTHAIAEGAAAAKAGAAGIRA
jgi:thioredoxin reductase (NADPH)